MLSAAERRLRAQIAANTRLAVEDPVEMTAAARAAGPSSIDYWIKQIDPDGALSEVEAVRRAKHARTAHMQQLAYRSARARARAS